MSMNKKTVYDIAFNSVVYATIDTDISEHKLRDVFDTLERSGYCYSVDPAYEISKSWWFEEIPEDDPLREIIMEVSNAFSCYRDSVEFSLVTRTIYTK